MPTQMTRIEDGQEQAGPAKVTLVSAGANGRRMWGVAKAQPPKENPMPADTKPPEQPAAKVDPPAPPALSPEEEMKAALKALVAKYGPDALKAALAAEAPPAAAKVDPVAEAVAKAKSEASEAIAKAQAESADLRKQIAEKEEKAADVEAIAKATTDHKGLPLKHEEYAPALRRFAKADPTAGAALDRALKSVSAIVAKSDVLTREIGKVGDPTGAADEDPLKQLAAKAEAIAKADPKITRFAAMERAERENPALVAAYRARK